MLRWQWGEICSRLLRLVINYNQFTRKGIDKAGFDMYNNFCITSLVIVFKLDRGNSDMEKYSRGRRGAPAKGVGRATGARVQIPLSPFSS